MENLIINILSSIFRFFDTFLCRCHIKTPKIIVYVDGGICSQMEMYLQGQYYAEYGLDVYYDTLWFIKSGKDQFGIMPRTFELTEMWPKLPFNTLSRFQRKFYLMFFKAQQTTDELLPEPETIKHSLYLFGYWALPIEDKSKLFAQFYDIRNAAVPEKNILPLIDEKTIGVHVRRGDLAKGDNPIYGGVSDGYFLRAIDFCNNRFAPSQYVFFSDEPDWVEKNICSQMQQPYMIMRGNKAWEDLYLLSRCSVIVASQGSFGPYAARLNPQAVLIECDNKFASRNRANTYYIK